MLRRSISEPSRTIWMLPIYHTIWMLPIYHTIKIHPEGAM
jgi:hypothetical protein